VEVFAGLSTLAIVLLVIVFLCALPGLITGWMLRASGRSFFWGFVLGTVFGPLGFLVALIFVLVGKPPQAQQITYQAPVQQQTSYSDEGYQYASAPSSSGAPWAIAGLAIIACACMAGVAAYVVASQGQRHVNTLQPSLTSLAPVRPTNPLAALPTPPSATATPLPTTTPSPAMIETIATPLPEVTVAPVAVEASPAASSAPSSAEATEPAQPVQLTAHDREDFITGMQESLRKKGIEATFEFRGTDKSILSMESASFSRPLVELWLDALTTRPSLKAAGVRSLIISNDSDTWSVYL